jgi:hypothetical protein
MTGFESKRQMAKAKVNDDDDTQVYADTLLIVYQRGFADGKRAAQRPWVGLTDEEVKHEWEVWRASLPRYIGFAQGIEAKLKERNNGH